MSLNTQELALCDKLADCWNEFLQLEIMHPTERTEFMQAIHYAQHIVMARSAVRAHKDKFYRIMDSSWVPKEKEQSNLHDLYKKVRDMEIRCGKCDSTNTRNSSTNHTNNIHQRVCDNCGEKIHYKYWPEIKRLSNA